MNRKTKKAIDQAIAIATNSAVQRLVLGLMVAFGMIAPDTATGIRDAVLAIAM